MNKSEILAKVQQLSELYYIHLLGRNVLLGTQSFYITEYSVTLNEKSFKSKVNVTIADYNGAVFTNVNISDLKYYIDDNTDDVIDYNTYLAENGNTIISEQIMTYYNMYKNLPNENYDSVLDLLKKSGFKEDFYKDFIDAFKDQSKNKSPLPPLPKPFTLDDAVKIICNKDTIEKIQSILKK